ncbi:hypothetical protein VPH35_008569 [Triticum aestivum]
MAYLSFTHTHCCMVNYEKRIILCRSCQVGDVAHISTTWIISTLCLIFFRNIKEYVVLVQLITVDVMLNGEWSVSIGTFLSLKCTLVLKHILQPCVLSIVFCNTEMQL